jgi:cysteine-rich repeat protein
MRRRISMKQVWLPISCLAAVMAFAAPAAAACGDFRLEVGEACDDGNVTPGDGCSAMCAVESGFVCEDVFFTLDGTGDLGVGGDAPANWILDADNRGVRETTNSHAAVYTTILPADVGEIVFDARVETTNDNDFWGWTIGYDVGELSATSTPVGTDFLFFSWKQGQQTSNGADRHSGLGLTRVTGTGSAANYWLGSGGNLTMIAESTNYPIDEALANGESTNGWDDNRWYRVNMIVTGTRVRVWVREGNTMNTSNPANRGFPALNRTTHLEFDVTTAVPSGNFGLYAFSQPDLRFDLVDPQSDSICSEDTDGDGVNDARDLDSDRDGVLDLVEMPGFTSDPDDDTDLDGIPDWRDPTNVPGGCTASMGACTTLPAALDVDGDGVPNHLDRDSDGDGLPDTLETGLTDVTADGVPDACVTVTSVGVCVAGGLAAGTLPPNTDGRGGANFLDLDSDADGIPDALEAGLTDANLNGAPDTCVSVTSFGLCVAGGLVGAAALPNTDMNGRPNYADRDSDGDGITDAREVGLLDANGDGVPNACTADVASGLCNAGGLAGAFPSTDGDGIVDYLDVDSDGDGLNDTIEAYDTDGNQVTNRPPVGTDTDNDGIDNAFDPDCVMAVCGGTLGAPVLGVLTAAQDANGDGTPDWLTLCGDGYRTGTEPCDDGNTSGADTCTNACLVTLTNPCTTSPQCDSGICNTASMTCATCVNNSPTGTDTGCNAALPACVTTGVSSMCVECDVTAQCGAEVCSSSNLCEVCIDSGAGTDTGCSAGTPNCIGASGARQCVQCTSAAQCNDGVACTTDACTANACVNTAVTTGGMGSCTGGQVCSGAPTNLCVTCTDTSAMGTDAGCMAGVPHCRTTGNGAPVCEPCLDSAAGSGTDLGCGSGTPYCVTGGNGANSCVACLTGADCSDNNTCTTDVCTAGVCSNPTVSTGTTCAGGVCNGAVPALCEVCIDSGSGTDTGCSAGTPNCIGASGARQCVQCTSAAQCNDGVACTTDACTANACVNTAVTTGGMGSCTGASCTGGQVCSGPRAPTNGSRCVTCTDTCLGHGHGRGLHATARWRSHCRTTGTDPAALARAARGSVQ